MAHVTRCGREKQRAHDAGVSKEAMFVKRLREYLAQCDAAREQQQLITDAPAVASPVRLCAVGHSP